MWVNVTYLNTGVSTLVRHNESGIEMDHGSWSASRLGLTCQANHSPDLQTAVGASGKDGKVRPWVRVQVSLQVRRERSRHHVATWKVLPAHLWLQWRILLRDHLRRSYVEQCKAAICETKCQGLWGIGTGPCQIKDRWRLVGVPGWLWVDGDVARVLANGEACIQAHKGTIKSGPTGLF